MEDRYSVILPEWYEANPDIEKALDYLLETPRRKSPRNTPLGYEFKNDHSEPVEGALLILVKMLGESRWKKARSLRDAVDHTNLLLADYNMKIHTAGGLSHVFTRIEVELGITDKITTPERQKIIRKERRLKREALGLKNLYHYTRSNQKVIDEQKRLTKLNTELKNLKKKEKRLKANAAKKAKNLGLKKDPTKYVEDDHGNLKYADSLKDYETKDVPKDPKPLQPENLATYLDMYRLKNNIDMTYYDPEKPGGRQTHTPESYYKFRKELVDTYYIRKYSLYWKCWYCLRPALWKGLGFD